MKSISFNPLSVINRFTLFTLLSLASLLGGVVNTTQAQVTLVNAASYDAKKILAPDSIGAAFGTYVIAPGAATYIAQTLPLPTTLGGVKVRINGVDAPLFFVAANQINLAIPSTLVDNNNSTITVINANNTQLTGTCAITRTSPGIFALNANSRGVAAGLTILAQSTAYKPIATLVNGTWVEADVDAGTAARPNYLVLYGTGIRASECAGLREQDLDLGVERPTIRVTGKGGHQRTIPLNARVVAALHLYRTARGSRSATSGVFESRRHRPMSRGAIYERVRHWSHHAKIAKTMSPHRLRHTFATHLVRAGVKLVTIRDLLGHRSIGSTQIYLHVTAEDLREAADRHPIQRLAPLVHQLLPTAKLPIQHPPWRRATG